MQLGIAGEVRAVIRRKDGSARLDTGYQKNIWLNKGLDYLGNSNSISTPVSAFCVIGSGNSTPVVTQTQLDAPVKGVANGRAFNEFYSTENIYDEENNIYKVSATSYFRFENMPNNTNIAEVGLANRYVSNSDYNLCTRALLKDSLGEPTVISIMSDEVLDIYYKIWEVYSTEDVISTIQLTSNGGEVTDYNATMRMSGILTDYYTISGRYADTKSIGYPLYFARQGYDSMSFTSSQDITSVQNTPSMKERVEVIFDPDKPYQNGEYKRAVRVNLGLNASNGVIRTIVLASSMGLRQFEFGAVADDSPFTKLNTQNMSFDFEFSWGRYEGEL